MTLVQRRMYTLVGHIDPEMTSRLGGQNKMPDSDTAKIQGYIYRKVFCYIALVQTLSGGRLKMSLVVEEEECKRE
jgi:hypothetical protein